MLADGFGEVLVNFDELWLELRPQTQTGATVAKIIQGQAYASSAYVLNRAGQMVHVSDPLVLGNFKNQHSGRHTHRVGQSHQTVLALGLQHAQQCLRADVDKQATRFAQVTPTRQCHSHTLAFKFKVQILVRCSTQQSVRGVKRRVVRAPNQGLVRKNRPITEHRNGLENRVQFFLAQQPIQWSTNVLSFCRFNNTHIRIVREKIASHLVAREQLAGKLGVGHRWCGVVH